MDAALISAAQRVEHYEIAAYGTVSAYADLLGEPEQASLLRQTLEEEKETDQKLTELSEQINVQANEAASEGQTKERQQAAARCLDDLMAAGRRYHAASFPLSDKNRLPVR